MLTFLRLFTSAVLVAGLAPAQAPLRIMPIGDSITHSSPGKGSYRAHLWRSLRNAGYCVDFVGPFEFVNGFQVMPPASDPTLLHHDHNHAGVWGITAMTVATQINGWLAGLAKAPDIALIHLGSNDVGAGRTIAQIHGDLTTIVNALLAKNRGMVIMLAMQMPTTLPAFAVPMANLSQSMPSFVGSLPPAPPAIFATVDMFNSFPVATGLEPDQVHPNAAGDMFLASQFFAKIQSLIAPPPANTPCAMQYGIGNVAVANLLNCLTGACSAQLEVSQGLPRIGTTFTMTATRMPTTATSAFAFIGLSDLSWLGTPLPIQIPSALPLLCLQFTGRDFPSIIPCASGTCSLAVPIPNLPGLVGTLWFAQFEAPDAAAGGSVVSNALRIRVGG